MGNGAVYDSYKRRRDELRRRQSTSYAGHLRTEIGQIGRQTQQTASQVESTLKRQNVPLSARVDAAGQLNQQFSQQVGQATSTFIQKEQGRQEQISDQLAEVQAAMDEAEAAKKRQTIDMMIQTGATIGGALLAAPTGGMSLLAGASIGSSVGQASSGAYNVIKGDATAQDYANISEGLLSGAQTVISETKLKSVQTQQQEALGKMDALIQGTGEYRDLDPAKRAEMLDFLGMQYETGVIYELPEKDGR